MANKTNLIVRGGADFSGLKKEMSKMQSSLKSFQTQSNAITSSLRKIGTIAAAAFGVRALINFSKESIKLASDMEEVQNVVDTAFGEMAYKMEEFANKSIAMYGISRLTSKQTGSSYMAMAVGMRFAAEQASDMALQLTALSADMASFFNIAQSEAKTALSAVFTGETETLKRYGILITEVNLQEYARQQGITKSIQKMTQQEKILLRYNYVLDATKLAQGDFQRTSDSWANQTKILSERWKEFKGIMGQGLIQALTPVIKVINSIISGLTTMATYFTSVMTALFGSQKKNTSSSQQQSGAIGTAVENQEALTAATKETGKAASKTLANFDELNVLSKETSGDGEDAATPVSGDIALGGNDIGEGSKLPEKVQDGVDRVMSLIEPLKNISFDNAKVALGELKKAIAPFTASIFAGLKWGWDNILLPLTSWVIEDALPMFLEVMASAIGFLNSALQPFIPLAKLMWDYFLQPIAKWTGGVIISTLLGLKTALDGISRWIKENKSLVESIIIVIGSFALSWGIVTAALNLWSIAVGVWNTIGGIATIITTAFGAAVNFLVSPIGLTILAIGALIAIVVLLVQNWGWVKEIAIKTWNSIVAAWNVAAAWFKGKVVEPIRSFFSGLWSWLTVTAYEVWANVVTAWQDAGAWFNNNVVSPIANFFKGLWDGVKATFTLAWDFMTAAFKGYVNGWITIIESFINFFIGAINLLIAGLNKISFDVPDWVPEIGGRSFGINIASVPSVKIPRLATGAVIPPNAEFLAVLGDQKRGMNIEAPLDTIVAAFNTALDSRGNQGGGDITIRFEGSMAQFVRELKPYIDKENRRVGRVLIQGV